jgi:FMN-dependent NADH-azoreductase
MTTILHVESSISGENSVSRQLTTDIIARLSADTPDAKVVTRDVTQGIAPIDGPWLGAMFTPEQDRSPEQQATADFADQLLAEVLDADVLVIGVPVYNFGVPAQLKTWFDHLARAGVTFQYTENGPEGLIKGKRAIIAMSSGGTARDSDGDYASTYVRQILGFLGITDIDVIAADSVAIDADASIAAATKAISALAA